MKCYRMLQSPRATVFTISELLKENQQGGGGLHTHTHTYIHTHTNTHTHTHTHTHTLYSRKAGLKSNENPKAKLQTLLQKIVLILRNLLTNLFS